MASKIKKRRSMRFFFVIFAMLILYAGVTLIKQQITLGDLSAQAAAVENELNGARDLNEQLTRDIEQSNTDEFIERQAREKLNWVKDGETRFVEQ